MTVWRREGKFERKITKLGYTWYWIHWISLCKQLRRSRWITLNFILHYFKDVSIPSRPSLQEKPGTWNQQFYPSNFAAVLMWIYRQVVDISKLSCFICSSIYSPSLFHLHTASVDHFVACCFYPLMAFTQLPAMNKQDVCWTLSQWVTRMGYGLGP